MMPVDVFSKAAKANLGSPSAMYLTIVAVFWSDLDSLTFLGPEG